MNKSKPLVVILNCPPQSGKDTIASVMEEKSLNTSIANFKDKLFDIALNVSGINHHKWFARYNSPQKEEPWDLLGGLSQRQYLIKISEEWVKPVFGKNYFGDSLVASIEKEFDKKRIIGEHIFIIPDGGFEEELEPLFDKFGKDNVLILQWTRNGADFSNDSRNYIKRGDGKSVIKIRDNNTTVSDQVDAVNEVVHEFCKNRK